jgi:diguanylate cyclase (GGDEF)-like protein
VVVNERKAMILELFQDKTAIFVLLLTIIVLVFITVIATYSAGKSKGRQQLKDEQRRIRRKSIDFEKIADYENKSNLNAKINELSELNSRYFNFIQHLTTVISQLYSSLNTEDTSTTIISLVKDVINTDIVELYYYDQQDNLLRYMNPLINEMDEQKTYALGDGLIGSVAEDGFMRIKGVTFSENDPRVKGDDTKFTIVSPIKFNENLKGVLGVGLIKNPTGIESKLLKLICDIAGVTLTNQMHLIKWKHGSMKDPLTGLYNRRYFSYMTTKYIEKSIVNNFPISVCLIDIDHFKNYNDMNGHQEGDRLLKELSTLLMRMTRKNSVVARYGGEEFIILMPNITKDEAFIYAEHIKQAINDYPFLHREKQSLGFVSVSVGVATFPDDAGTIEKVIELADKSLYKAKNEGRNRVIKHDRHDMPLKG